MVRPFKLPRTKHRGPAGEARPQTMALRMGPGGEVVDGRLRPLQSGAPPAAAAEAAAATHGEDGKTGDCANSRDGRSITNSSSGGGGGGRSIFSFARQMPAKMVIKVWGAMHAYACVLQQQPQHTGTQVHR